MGNSPSLNPEWSRGDPIVFSGHRKNFRSKNKRGILHFEKGTLSFPLPIFFLITPPILRKFPTFISMHRSSGYGLLNISGLTVIMECRGGCGSVSSCAGVCPKFSICSCMLSRKAAFSMDRKLMAPSYVK